MTRSLISHDCYADTLRTIKRVPSFNIAAEIENEEFIAHSSCQYLLNIRWSGRLILEEGNRFKVKYLLQQMVALIITLLFEICICFFLFVLYQRGYNYNFINCSRDMKSNYRLTRAPFKKYRSFTFYVIDDAQRYILCTYICNKAK